MERTADWDRPMTKDHRLRHVLGSILLLVASGIFLLNLYGMTQSLRHPDLAAFDAGAVVKGNTVEIDYSQIMAANPFGIKMTRAEARNGIFGTGLRELSVVDARAVFPANRTVRIRSSRSV